MKHMITIKMKNFTRSNKKTVSFVEVKQKDNNIRSNIRSNTKKRTNNNIILYISKNNRFS